MKSEAGKKSFDVMKWLRETRDRHYEETKDMTPEERLRWLKKRPSDPGLAELFDRIKVVKPVPTAPGGVRPFRDQTGWRESPVRLDDLGYAPQSTVAGPASMSSWIGWLAVREPPPGAAKLRVYIDTSVIGGCLGEEFQGPSRRLIERAGQGKVTLVVSSVTNEELRSAPVAVRGILEAIAPRLERIRVTDEVERLADRYIESGAIGAAMRSDAEHIAAATVAGVDMLASWNFRHMVNLWRIRQYNAVNRMMGYGFLDIRSPRELEHGE